MLTKGKFLLMNIDRLEKFFKLFREGRMSEISCLELYYFIKELKCGTEKQKENFCLYFSIYPSYPKNRTYSDISREQGCFISNIRYSVGDFFRIFRRKMNNEELEKFDKIVQFLKYKNGKQFNVYHFK